MVTGAYRDVFVAIAGAAGALTGLLFVALSVAPRPRAGQQPDVIRQIRAGAALLAFTNALAVSLFGLVPHNEIGYPAVVAGVGGLLFTLGGVRSILADPAARRRIRSQVALIVLLLGVFGFEIGAGINSIITPHTDAPIDVIGNVLAASLLIGIARSWELVGDRDTGIVSSLAALAGHDRHLGGSVAGPADVPRDDAADPAGPASPTQVAGPATRLALATAAGPLDAGPEAGQTTLPPTGDQFASRGGLAADRPGSGADPAISGARMRDARVPYWGVSDPARRPTGPQPAPTPGTQPAAVPAEGGA